ncbi:MAG TPA: VWA domain-containing protein [Candidatus Acidoferrales bacterium]|nr:VWA domain-containing protein [Candidatus Acidoferrales bacterium]
MMQTSSKTMLSLAQTNWQTRFSRAPTRTSEGTLREIVNRIGRYYGIPVVCELSEYASTASIDLAHHKITLPTYLTKAHLPRIVFYSRHEFLHAKVMPQTAHMQAYYIALAAERGVKAPAVFANLFADQTINDYGMREEPFKLEFTKGCAAFYKDRASKLRKQEQPAAWALWHFFNMLQRAEEYVATPRKQAKMKSNSRLQLTETMKELYRLVFLDERPLEERYKEAAEIARDLFKEDESEQRGAVPCGHDELPPIKDPKELQEWVEKMRRLSPDSAMKGARASGSKRVLLDYAELQALDAYIISQSKAAAQKAKETAGGEFADDMWTPEDRVDELDMRLTLQTSGVFVPYLTAVRRTAGTEMLEESHGAGLQAYVLDVSGSMMDDLDIVAMLCFAISLHAKRRRDEVAMLTFSDQHDPAFLLKPGHSYEQIRPILESLEGGGSTYLAPALTWLNEYSGQRRLKPTAILFTDTGIFDSSEALSELQRTRQLGGTTILVNTSKFFSGWVQTAKEQGLLDAFQVDYEHLDNIQRILQRVA